MGKVACVIPTYNGRILLERLINSLDNQTASFDVLLVDSGSTDGTREFISGLDYKVVHISSREFNHGGTRQLLVDLFPLYSIYIFLTQDVLLADCFAIERLIESFENESVGAAYGRQLPHSDATPLSAHARYFNYPAFSSIKSFIDVPRLGIRTAFISNSFAAYRGTALRSVGGFPSNVILGEDMYVAAKLIMAGWKVSYNGLAICHHSHNYSLKDEFSRYFDIGVFHSRERWIRTNFGGAGGEGKAFAKSELFYLGFKRFYLWPSSIVRCFIKLMGYKLGYFEMYLPVALKRRLGMHKQFWDCAPASKH